MFGKTESKRRRGWQRKRWLDRITDSTDRNFSKCWEIVNRVAIEHHHQQQKLTQVRSNSLITIF